MSAKTFVFCVGKNICLWCQEKHFAFCCRVLRLLHSEEKLACSGLTVKLSHIKEAIHGNYLSNQTTSCILKQYHSLYAQCERENIQFKLNYSFADLQTNLSCWAFCEEHDPVRSCFHCFRCCFDCYCGGAVVEWLASWTSDLEVGGSSLVIAVVLFP